MSWRRNYIAISMVKLVETCEKDFIPSYGVYGSRISWDYEGSLLAVF